MNKLKTSLIWLQKNFFIVAVFTAAIFFYLSRNNNHSYKWRQSQNPSSPEAAASPGVFGAKGESSAQADTVVAEKKMMVGASEGFAGRGDLENAMAADAVADGSTSLTDLLTPSAHADSASQMLIRNGHMSMYVDHLTDIKPSLLEKIKKAGAYVENENQYEQYSNVVLSLTLKVPSEKFQALFDDLLTLKGKIQSQSVNVDDVLKQYTDVKSRLANKIELQKRFRDLVKKAVKVSDILEIERELARVSEDIDSTTKIMKQYENDVRLSTISITLTEPKAESSNGPAPMGFFKKVGLSVKSGFDWVLDSVLEFISYWPLWILVAAVYLYWRKKRKK